MTSSEKPSSRRRRRSPSPHMATVPELPAALRDDRDDPLFPEGFLQRLDYLHLVARKILSGQMKAERRSRKKGVSIEFADHRPYAPGDDFRFIDWNVYFRTDKFFLKLFEEEEDLHVYVLVDESMSMDYGMPYKWHYARRLAAAIGYLALAGQDRVAVLPFSSAIADGAANTLRVRGKGRIYELFRFLEGRETHGPTSINESLRKFALGKHKRGLAVVISDLLDPEGVIKGLGSLYYQKFDLFVVQVVSPQEAEPGLLGDVRLEDSEADLRRDVTLNETMLRRYREVFDGYCRDIEQFCRARELGYMRCRTDVPFDDAVLHMLRRGKLFQ